MRNKENVSKINSHLFASRDKREIILIITRILGCGVYRVYHDKKILMLYTIRDVNGGNSIVLCWSRIVHTIADTLLTVIGQMGQQLPGSGGFSLQLSRPLASQLHVVQEFSSHLDPSGWVLLCWSIQDARHRQICVDQNLSRTTHVYHHIVDQTRIPNIDFQLYINRVDLYILLFECRIFDIQTRRKAT